MEEKGEERCTPCRPHPAGQPVFPDSSERTDWASGEQGGPGDRQEPRSLRRARCYLVAFRSCRGGSPSRVGEGQRGPRRRLSRGAPLGAQGEGVRDGSGGGQGEESRRRLPPTPCCGFGMWIWVQDPWEAAVTRQSLKLLPAWLRGLRGAGLSGASTRERRGGWFWQLPPPPPPHPRSRGIRAQRIAAWCPLVGLEDALLEAPGTEVEGKGVEDLHQSNWERPSARLAAPPPSCPPRSSRGSLGQL